MRAVVLGLTSRMMTAANRWVSGANPGVVLGVARLERDVLEVERGLEVHGGDDVPG